MRQKLGVVIGRFQVPSLHDGHKMLINYVQERNDKLVIIIGVSPIGLSYTNPLPLESIQHSIKSFIDCDLYSIKDCKSDKIWSSNIDKLLVKNYPEYDICLYGSRDSFIHYYHGELRCEEIPSDPSHVPATKIRTGLGKFVEDNIEFRKGIIYAIENQFPTSYQCVDIGVTYNNELLIGKKSNEDVWRLPGGFVDVTDKSLEQSASRELYEETNLLFFESEFKYLGSFRINDWRYKKQKNKVMTSLFLKKVNNVNDLLQLKAGDDLNEVKFVPLNQVIVGDFHQDLVNKIKQYESII